MALKFRHVILDRDGVLNVEDPDGGYVLAPGGWVWEPGALRAVARLQAAGVVLSVATNQRCVARGLITIERLDRLHDRIRHDAGIEAIYVCPHAPEDGCRCRKPGPELLERAIAASGIAPEDTLFVGDSPTDLRAAANAGIAGWLVRTGKGRATEAGLAIAVPTFDDLSAAAAAVVR